MIVVVKPGDVTIGMYVDSFEGSWLSHPFWKAGFLLSSQNWVDRIIKAGVPVRIDTSKGRCVSLEPAPPASAATGAMLSSRKQASVASTPTRKAGAVAFGRADRNCTITLARRSENVVKALFEECRLGHDMPVTQLLSVVDEISTALERDSSTFIAVTRLRAKDDCTYTHSISVCALMIGMGRRLGYGGERVRDLGMAGLLHDIGKLRVPDAVLKKPDSLTVDEAVEMRRHPQYGHEMMLAAEGLPAVALDVCLHHHERLDGSGYPFGLTGDMIGEAVRIASLCDAYDAMTSTRPYRKGLAPADAVAQLGKAMHHFDRRVVFQLMASLGIYPAELLVRLRTNRLAVALPVKRGSSQPVFRAFYSTVDARFTPYEDVPVGETLAGDQAVGSEDPAAWFTADWEGLVARILSKLPIGKDKAEPLVP